LLILITNDDGVNAEGIQTLRKELSKIGETFVFAPDREQSGTSHSFSLRRPLKVTWIDSTTASVGGTPTDCIMLAVRGLLKERPRIIVSGINHGPNMGDDVTYSGTVAAAIEGTLLGIPSLAFSVACWNSCRFDFAATFARELVRKTLKEGLPLDTLLNVNIPNLPPEEIRGVKITKLGKRIYRDFVLKKVDPSGSVYYWIDGEDPSWEKEEETDFAAIEEKMISITPFHLDLTAYHLIQSLKRWEEDLSSFLPRVSD